MYAYEIIIQNHHFKKLHDIQYEKWVHDAYTYIYLLEASGQIVRDKSLVIIQGDTIRMPVLTFEKEPFLEAYHNTLGWAHKKGMQEHIGGKIYHTLHGRDADNPNYKIPKNPSFLLLRFGWESALLCGDTHKPIPLYHLFDPQKIDKIFDEIGHWDREYERIFNLWISSGSYEAFAQKELEYIHSALNEEGVRLCKEIETLTQKPCFYHLFNNRNWSEEEDKNRECPLCGGMWQLEGKGVDDFIAFKCEKCHLTSELSPNAR